jgi:MFS transporter, BCD family, chlorophyll transporter
VQVSGRDGAAGPVSFAGEAGAPGLSWSAVVRVGCVQMAIGSVIAMTTSTLNRIMVVELALAAVVPGLLVGLYYAIQASRPYWGYRSDAGRRRTPWIVGGMAVLAAGGLVATLGTVLADTRLLAGLALASAGFALIGAGAGAAATSLLAFLATGTEPARRAAAATITWLMMIAGIAATATIVGQLIDPYSHGRLIRIVAVVCVLAFGVAVAAMSGLERTAAAHGGSGQEKVPFRTALAGIWSERRSRRFALFVFLSMLAYSMQELILEPYAGHVFGFTPGGSTTMAGLQNGAVLLGVVAVGGLATGLGLGSLRFWTSAGCFGSAVALGAIALAGATGSGSVLLPPVFCLGFANGVFAVAAIGSMMQLAGADGEGREGARMGLWGGAQAIAAGAGGLLGAAGADVMRLVFERLHLAYGAVFLIEAALFVVAALLALTAIERPGQEG